MLDVYPYFLGLDLTWDATANSGTAPAAPGYYITSNAVGTAGTCTLAITTLNTSSVATIPASGEAMWLGFTFKNSTAP